jgi:hypothetical protein
MSDAMREITRGRQMIARIDAWQARRDRLAVIADALDDHWYRMPEGEDMNADAAAVDVLEALERHAIAVEAGDA